jgi:hypothetical protein
MKVWIVTRESDDPDGGSYVIRVCSSEKLAKEVEAEEPFCRDIEEFEVDPK